MANGGTFRWRPSGKADIRNATASGMLNVLLYGEERVKAVSVVRGGNRSFLTGSHLGGPLGITEDPKLTASRAKATVGGTLRRSWHAIVFVDGRVFPGSRTIDENGKGLPNYPRGSVVVGWIGSNSGYGEWVDQGTSKMPARPMLIPSIQQMIGAAANLFRAGWGAYARRFR
jgi:hypothetical protein